MIDKTSLDLERKCIICNGSGIRTVTETVGYQIVRRSSSCTICSGTGVYGYAAFQKQLLEKGLNK